MQLLQILQNNSVILLGVGLLVIGIFIYYLLNME